MDSNMRAFATLALMVACLPAVCVRADFPADPPNDPFYVPTASTPLGQYALPLMHVPQAWNHSTGSPDVKIGVVDTGIVFDTPELQGRYLSPIDATVPGTTTGVPDTSALFNHGTWVASEIAMPINNG